MWPPCFYERDRTFPRLISLPPLPFARSPSTPLQCPLPFSPSSQLSLPLPSRAQLRLLITDPGMRDIVGGKRKRGTGEEGLQFLSGWSSSLRLREGLCLFQLPLSLLSIFRVFMSSRLIYEHARSRSRPLVEMLSRVP